MQGHGESVLMQLALAAVLIPKSGQRQKLNVS